MIIVLINQGTNKYIKRLPSSYSLYEKQKKLHFVEQLISAGEYYQCDGKISPKGDGKKHRIHIIPTSSSP